MLMRLPTRASVILWFDADGSRVDEAPCKLAYIDSANFNAWLLVLVLFGTDLMIRYSSEARFSLQCL